MILDKRILVTTTSRLFADEVVKLQEFVGAILVLKEPHKLQNIASVGLGPVCPRSGPCDYVAMLNYISRSTLAILDEVSADGLSLTRIDPNDVYQIKNVYRPFFQWDSYSLLCVMPPIFDKAGATVSLESNGCEVVFPCVLPHELGQNIVQQLLLYNIYSRLADHGTVGPGGPIDQGALERVRLLTTRVTHLGRQYELDLGRGGAGGIQDDPTAALASLDSLAVYTAILSALLPRACMRLITSLLRHDEHELLDVFRGVVPPEIVAMDLDGLDIEDDMVRMGTFLSYLQSLSTVFNLGTQLHIASYSPEALLATCWCGY